MSRGSKIILILMVLVCGSFTTPSEAGLKGFLKMITQPTPTPTPAPGQSAQPAQPPPPQPNKTESLIFGGLKVLKSLMPIGYQEELAIGGAVALEAVSRFGGLWQDAAAEKYVATVGNAVALTSDRPDIPYFFGILNSDDPNAFACPGGYIFISKGLLKLVKNEAQLAGILGHEIAHVAQKHALEAIRRSKALGGISEVTLTALDKDPKMFDSVVKETVNMILESGVGREKELEADRLGADYAYRVGYNPEGLLSFLEVLKPQMAHSGPLNLKKTHPDPADRINNLRGVLARADFAGYQKLPLLAERYTSTAATFKF